MAVTVILMSLVIAAVTLPFMTRFLKDELPHESLSGNTEVALTEAAINRINELLSQSVEDPQEELIRKDVGYLILEILQRRLQYDGSEKKKVILEGSLQSEPISKKKY